MTKWPHRGSDSASSEGTGLEVINPMPTCARKCDVQQRHQPHVRPLAGNIDTHMLAFVRNLVMQVHGFAPWVTGFSEKGQNRLELF